MSLQLIRRIKKLNSMLYAMLKLRKGKKGKRVCIYPKANILNAQYISMGDYCYLGPNCRIEAWDHYNNVDYKPSITLGKDVRINSTCHIGAINRIEIGDECLLGSHVLIIDHSHGYNSCEELKIHPSKRDLFSKGAIIIGPRCWICENAVVLPNVKIGEGAVIAANCVVTKDVPPYSVVAGNPGRIVKTICQEDKHK